MEVKRIGRDDRKRPVATCGADHKNILRNNLNVFTTELILVSLGNMFRPKVRKQLWLFLKATDSNDT
jgi:hypothetical protein